MKATATLGWYELPETREHHDRLWRELARHLAEAGIPEVPPRLSRLKDPHDISPRLLLGQQCGYFVAGAGREKLIPLVALRFAASGCQGARYRSFVVTPRAAGAAALDDLADRRAAVSEPQSHSGYHALRRMVGDLDSFFASVRATGSHLASLAALRRGDADVAAIDCVTWQMLERYRPAALEGLAVIDQSPPAPAPPLVTAAAFRDRVPALREGIERFFADARTAEVREALLWQGAEVVDRETYRALIEPGD